MDEEKGWIKIHRKFLSWEWYTDDKTKSVFFHFLLIANVKPTKWKGIQLERGEFIRTLPTLSEELNLSVQEIRTAINHLKSTGEITERTTGRIRVIKVCNYGIYQETYGDYQQNNQQDNQQTANRISTEYQQDSNRISTADKELKNIRNKELKNKEKDFKKHIPVSGETASKPKQEKHKYGEYGHVFLTDGERDRLFNDYGETETMKAIKYLDDCIEMKGYKYKSHNLALRKWVFNALKEDELRKQKINGNLRSGRQQNGEGFLDGIADWVSKNQEGGTDDGCGAIW